MNNHNNIMMKIFLITFLIGIGIVSLAQQSVPSTVKTRISDDEKTLSIQIEGNKNGHRVHFNQAFDVAGMSTLRKEVLKLQIFTSLGISLPLHEMPWLLCVVLALAGLITTLIIRNKVNSDFSGHLEYT